MTLNYIIIDDEPLSHKVIETFASEIPLLNKVGNCYSALEVDSVLNYNSVDLIFLDIQMPKLQGFEFLRSLKSSPYIIVISAHKEYALEGYELDISDYLLKPFRKDRFLKAIQKVADAVHEQPKGPQEPTPLKSILIKDEKTHHQVALDELIYIEAAGNYAMVHLASDRILTQMKISEFEDILPPRAFVRTHRSFIVSVSKIKLFKAGEVHLETKIIPVGRVYKENVKRVLAL